MEKNVDIEMKNLMKRSQKFIILTVLVTLFSSLVIIIVPIMVNYYLQVTFIQEIYFIILLLGISAVSLFFQIFLTILREKFSVNFNLKNSIQMYKTMFKLKYDELNKYGPTYLVDRIATAVNAIYLYICSSLTALISNIVVLLAVIVTILFVTPLVSAILVIIIPINYFGMKLINKKLYQKSTDLQKTAGENYRNIISLVANVDFTKQNFAHDDLMDYLEEPLKKVFSKTADINKYAQSSSSIIWSINILFQNIIIVFLGLAFNSHHLAVNSIILVSMLLPIFFNSLNGLVNCQIEMKDFKASYAFYQEIAGKSEVDGSLELLDIDSVTIKKSSYAIHGKVITIPDDYQLVKGDRVYLSGPSGVGKSTILKLFPRFRDCDFIQINGHNLEDYSLKSLRKKVSYLAPDTAIIPLTLKSNLTLAVEFKDDNSLFNLMDSAVLKPILVNKNLDTLINEGGSNLSGGEKQRIALARELLKNTDVLLLDEATNSLDDNYSELIMKQIFEKFSNKIIILVSHNEDFRNYCQKEIKLNIATPEL